MRRLFVIVALLLALVGVPAVTHAQDVNPANLAQYFPAETQLYAATRTDDAFIDTLDAILVGLRDKLPQVFNVPQMGLRDGINTALDQDNLTLNDLRAWLGDTAAFGLVDVTAAARQGGMGADNPGYLVIEITDKSAAEAFFATLPNFSESTVKSEENGYTVYRPSDENQRDGGFLALNDDVAIVGFVTAELPSGGLDRSPKFIDWQEKLPESSYNALIYIDVAPLFAASLERNPDGAEALDAAGIDLTMLNPAVIGFTILDGKSLTVDIVQPSLQGVLPALTDIDPGFAANIPDNFSFVIHASDLTNLINAALDAVEKASQTTPSPVTRTQITGLLQAVIGLDLDEDVLSWMTGDFALLADWDMLPFLDAVAAGEEPQLDPRFAFIMDASTDPAKAQKVAQTLGERIMTQMQQSQNSEVTASMTEIAGVKALLLEDVPVLGGDSPLVDVVLGANDNVLLLADRTTAEAIFSGNFTPLSDSPALKEAAAYILPGTFTVLYAEGTGWGDLVALGGGLMIAFNSTSEADEEALEIVEALKFAYELFSSSSISAVQLGDGDVLVRAVLTLK